MFKKAFSRIAATVLTLSIVFSSVAGAVSSVELVTDTKTNYLKYIGGYADGSVRPDTSVTRAQGAKMLSFVMDVEGEDSGKTFSDVPSSHWGSNAISLLSSADVIGGYADGTFKPDKYLTRAEFVAILTRLVKPTPSNTNKFSDISGHWAEADICALVNAGFIGGYGDGTFKPDNPIFRAEAVKLINRAVNIITNPDENRQIFNDLPKSHWAYYEIMAAASPIPLESPIKHGTTKFDDIKYIDLNPTTIKSMIDEMTAEFPNASTERQAEIYKEFSKLEMDFSLAAAMTQLNSSRDTSNQKYKIDLVNLPAVNNILLDGLISRYNLVKKAPNREKLSELIDTDINKLEEPSPAMEEKLLNLITEQQKYVNEFDSFYNTSSITYKDKGYSLAQAEFANDSALRKIAYDYYLAHYKEYGTIFDNLVKVRTKIANYFGAETYTDIGYAISGKTTYTPADVSVLRNDIKKYIVPVFNKIIAAQNGDTSNGYKKIDYKALDSGGDTIASSISLLHRLSPQTRETVSYMSKYNMLDLESRENKASGAFTLTIPQHNTPFLFMNKNGGYEDTSTFNHEFGHSLQAFNTDSKTQNYTYDIAEIASYGMEMLTSLSYDELFGESSGDVFTASIFEKVNLILGSTAIDEFQYLVYSNPNMTIEERNTLYNKIQTEYFGADNRSEAHKKGIIWTNPSHIFGRPYYGIDYTLALTTAIQIWQIARDDFDLGFETYISIIESQNLNLGIDVVTRESGLKTPFEKGLIKSLADSLDTELKTVPLSKAS